jgi:hypothetical protein
VRVFAVKNVTEALENGLVHIRRDGVLQQTRNGPALVYPGPVTTVYEKPRERVLLSVARDANPFFHFFESLWMLAGQCNGQFLDRFVKDFTSRYSDDGVTLHGAYGYRWREQWGDQLAVIVDRLKNDPSDRRSVLQIWSAELDLGKTSRDLPCNTIVFFSVGANEFSEPCLDMTVCNRSNDLIWGAYGANAVHFTMLQEYVATSVGASVGRYWQVSNNFHAYVETLEPLEEKIKNLGFYDFSDPYIRWLDDNVEPYPLMTESREIWDQDLLMFIERGPIVGMRDPFFRRVATPMWHAWREWKRTDRSKGDRVEAACEILDQCVASDWKQAAIEWLNRRNEK